MASPIPPPPSLPSKQEQEDTPMPDLTTTTQALPSTPLPPLLSTLLSSPPKDLETFTHRKAEILRTLSLPKIQALYEEEIAKVLLMLEEDQRNNDEIRKEIEMLEKQQELERRIYSKMPGSKGREEDKKIGLGIMESLGRGEEEGEVFEESGHGNGEDVKMEGV